MENKKNPKQEEERREKNINELIMIEDDVEMKNHMDNCEQCQGQPMEMIELLGCNIYDEHFEDTTHEQSM